MVKLSEEESTRRIERRISYLTGLGVKDPQKVLDANHGWGYSVQYMENHVKYFEVFGISSVPSLIDNCPKVLSPGIDCIGEKLLYLEEMGIKDVCSVVEKTPEIIGTISIENMKEHFQYLKDLGIEDVGGFIERRPNFLTRSPETSKNIVTYLESLGV